MCCFKKSKKKTKRKSDVPFSVRARLSKFKACCNHFTQPPGYEKAQASNAKYLFGVWTCARYVAGSKMYGAAESVGGILKFSAILSGHCTAWYAPLQDRPKAWGKSVLALATTG